MMAVRTRPELYLLLGGIVFAALVGEALARVATAMSDTPASSYLLYTSPHYRLDSGGAMRHIPDERIRSVRLIDDVVEFDIRYRTNNLGFVDDRPYHAELARTRARQYAFVGDSFAQGMGAEPWIPKLRDDLQADGANVEIYNLGVAGASLLQCRRLLKSVSLELPFTDIVLIVITDDFFRPMMVPAVSDGKIRFCPEGEAPAACAQRTAHLIIDEDDSLDEILARTHAIERAAWESMPPLSRLARQSEFFVLGRRALRVALRRARGEVDADADPQALQANLEALAAIRTDFPDLPIHLVHFPEIREARAGRYRHDFEERIRATGVSYFPALSRCAGWSEDVYHSRDGHPNATGYDVMARCLTSQLLRPAAGDTR